MIGIQTIKLFERRMHRITDSVKYRIRAQSAGQFAHSRVFELSFKPFISLKRIDFAQGYIHSVPR